jgi:hypothetical protein
MLDLLSRLDDADTIERFLTDVTATGCYNVSDNAAIVGALNHLTPPLATAVIARIVSGTVATAFGAVPICCDGGRRNGRMIGQRA